jgi:cytidylate kinase
LLKNRFKKGCKNANVIPGLKALAMTPARNPKAITLCICGLAGSGKSTLARKLAKQYDLEYFSGGDALKALAIEEGYKPTHRGWWESSEGMRFLKNRRSDLRFDKEVDRKLIELSRNGNVVLDSWTMPWLLKQGFKVWLEVGLEERARRIAKRDRIGFNEAVKSLECKEEQTKDIYQRMYGFALGEDFAPFQFILDTDLLRPNEVFQVVCKVVDNVVFAK